MFIEHGEDRTCAERDNRSEAHASPFPLLHIFLNFSPSRTLLALRFAAPGSPSLYYFTYHEGFLMWREKCVETKMVSEKASSERLRVCGRVRGCRRLNSILLDTGGVD